MTSHPPLSAFAQRLDVPRTFTEVLGGRPPGAVDLLGGNPATEALPRVAIAEAVARAASDPGAPAFQYSSPRGLPRLVDLIAAREGVSPARVVVANGALHALSLIVLALLGPDDVVVTDDPVYPVFRRVLQLAGSRTVGVGVDSDGLDTDALERLLQGGLRPRLVYTVPDFQNPTGATLSAARRERLADLAHRYGFLVLWDNPYRRTRWNGREVADAAVDDEAFIRIDTFSKSLGPGLRTGWAVVPEWLVPALVAVRSRTDQHPGTLVQAAVADLLAQPGAFDGIVRALAEEHARRASALTAAIRRDIGSALTFGEPDGGFFLWTRLADAELSASRLRELSLARGTAFSAGEAFAVPGGASHTDALRLGFSATPVADIPVAVARIADALDALDAERSIR
ncbi:PLP-dependent aminotransferase family protein [Microbacterium betulae]|uniref:PLP-dependent aminotransferase family protein n=1 Tax=Microbacterium betulae TaxID=2981139 RepID=A0AA97I5Q9_9MICO|nr:PLP-dependent aminotransferase family protein [Microbacterium sp. AB]WOF22347.1 PLP-dependent aminotransferase family protein [Microbacterium sp. AB]